MMSPLRRVAYTSHASTPLELDDFVQPIAEARATYRRYGIKALLIYDAKDRSLFEVMEGPAAAVERVLEWHHADERTWGMACLLDVVAEDHLLAWSRGVIYVPADREIHAVRAFRAALVDGHGGAESWLAALENLIQQDVSGEHPGLVGSDSSHMRPAIEAASASDDKSHEKVVRRPRRRRG